MGAKIVEELAFYGAYHSNLGNQLVHIVCVPMIMWSALLALGLLTKNRALPFLTTLAYCTYYIKLDRTVGVISSFVYLAMWKQVDALLADKKTQNKKSLWAYAALAQIVGWGVQITIGHAILEKRKPALLDSFIQALTLAPLFVVYETIWLFVPQFQHELKMQVASRVREIQAGF